MLPFFVSLFIPLPEDANRFHRQTKTYIGDPPCRVPETRHPVAYLSRMASTGVFRAIFDAGKSVPISATARLTAKISPTCRRPK